MARRSDIHGVLVVDKPAGMTSARVVAEVKRRTRAGKVGHTGTLDPMATGVLPLCLGEATKLASFLLAEDKAYEGELCLGVETDTLDADGAVTAEHPERAAAVGETELRREIAALVGPLEQVPPMFSALKQGGRRLHELARAGVEVERPARRVEVERFELQAFEPPRARFEVACSKGTYVRSLVRDLGRALGAGAHLTALRRTRAGAFGLEHAVKLEEIRKDEAPGRLVPPDRAVAHLPAAEVPADLLEDVANGRQLRWEVLSGGAEAPGGLLRLRTPAGELLALAEVGPAGQLRYQRVFRFPLTRA